MNRFLVMIITAALLISAVGCESSKSPTAPRLLSPGDLRAALTSPTSVSLNWTDNSKNEEGFKVNRTIQGENNWTLVVTVGAGVVAVADTGLAEKTSYQYYVAAYSGTSISPSDTIAVTTSLKPPAGLSIETVTATSIALVWNDNSSAENAYAVERKSGAGRYEHITDLPANSTTYTDASLTPNTSYTYRIAAISGQTSSAWSNEAVGRTGFLPPIAPSNLTASTLNIAVIRLTWQDNSADEEGFMIERSNDGGVNWTLRITIGPNAAMIIDTGLTEGTNYSYRIRAFLQSELSQYSNIAAATTPPAAPTQLTASRDSETSIRLGWTDASHSETEFEIEQRTTDGALQYIRMTANSVEYLDINLTPNATYAYHIRAWKDSLRSSWSNEATARTSLLTPEPPSNLTARSTDQTPGEAQLNWSDFADNEAGFAIEISENRNTGWTICDTVPANQTEAMVSGLPSEAVRYFRLYAFNEHGVSANSNIATCTIVGVPPGPSNLVAQSGIATPTGAALSWQDNSMSEAGFEVESSLDGATNWVVQDSLGANVVSVTVRGLPVEQEVFFRVRAYNSSGSSEYSNVASAVIAGLPIAPTTLVASAPTYFAVLLEWQDNSRAEDDYFVERRIPPGIRWTRIATLPANIVHYNDSTVSPAQTYAYRVQAHNIFGGSQYTNEAQATTPRRPPAQPTGLSHEIVDVDYIQLLWNDNSNDEDGFFLERKGPDDNSFTLIDVIEPNVSAYMDDELTPETWYSYRVRAHNNAGYSEWSNVDSAQTLSLTCFNETFETYDINSSPPAPWTMMVGGTSWAQVMDTRPHEGAKSFQFHDPDVGANYALGYATHRPVMRGTFTTWVYIPDSSYFGVFGTNPSLFYTFQIQFENNDSFIYRDGGGFVEGGGYPVDQWFKVAIIFNMDSSNYHIEFNDQVVTPAVAVQVADHAPAGVVGAVGYNGAEVTDAFVDDMTVIQYREEPERAMRYIPKGRVVADSPGNMKLGDRRAFPVVRQR